MALKSALFSALSTVGANTSAYKIYLLIEQLSKDVNANTSQVRFYSYMVFTPGGNPTYNNYDGVNNYWLKVDDATVTSGTRRLDFRNSYTIVIADVTRTIAHDANGNKTVKGEAYQYIDDVSAWRYAQVSGSLTLETIPRASKFTASNVNAGAGSIPISLTKSPAATTHKAKVMFGSTVICDKDIGANPTSIPLTTAEWNIFYNLTKTVTAGSLVITLTTYNGSTILGTDAKTITATYASTDIPTLSGLTATETNSTVLSKLGAGNFLQYLSKIRLTVGTVTGVKGSTITDFEIKVATTIYTANNTVITPQTATAHTVSARVKDSRGRWSNSIGISFTPKPYSYPRITAFDIKRATSAGVVDILGTFARMVIGASVASVVVGTEKNQILYRVDDITNTTVNKVNQTLVATSVNTVHTVGTYPITDVALFKLRVTDGFGQWVEKNFTLSTADVPFTLGKYGVAIGGVVNNNLPRVLQVHGDAEIFGGRLFIDGHEIVENGSNSNGTYTKFADGTMICRHVLTSGVGNNASGNVFLGTLPNWTYPATFIEAPQLSGMPRYVIVGGPSCIGITRITGVQPNGLHAQTLYVVYSATSTAVQIQVDIVAIGRWK